MAKLMIDVLDSGWLRVGAYGIVSAQAIWWGLRERRWVAERGCDWWPTYWFLSAIMLITMGAARAGVLGDLVSDIGRDQARTGGWYDSRRTLQAIAVIAMAMAMAWAFGVIVAIWRVAPQRRRYLPHVLALSAVIAFAAVRLVSLHQVDTVLYRRDIGGIRIVALVELTLLAITPVAALATSRFDDVSPERRSPHTSRR